MNFKDYQEKAKETIQKSFEDNTSLDNLIPFYLGIVGETGSVISELKKKLRDGKGYNMYKPQLKEELGDVLWYLSTIATLNGLDFQEIAINNIQKTHDRFKKTNLYEFDIFDKDYPEVEQFPGEFEIQFVEETEGELRKLKILDGQGDQIGNTLTDNSYSDDGYRYHDIFHFGYVAFLGWSPVTRKLMEIKRKSNKKTDEVEDGARAAIVEELIALYIYNHAQEHELFQYSQSVDSDVLKTIKKMVAGLEVKNCSSRQWEAAIIESYKVFNELVLNRGGRVLVSKKNRKLLYIGNK